MLTFLFTDIEGSTRLWEDHPAGMEVALAQHDDIVRGAISSHGGYIFSQAGDGFGARFDDAAGAVDAAVLAREGLAAAGWPDGVTLRVRMGLHTGSAQHRAGDYFGPDVNRAARIMSAGHGGQILLSSVTATLVPRDDLVDLGPHRLRDVRAADHLWQLGAQSFPSLRSVDLVPHNLPERRVSVVGRSDEVRQLQAAVRTSRLVTVTGLGGVGKTTAALVAAEGLAGDFADGVWFVDLVPVSDPSAVPRAIAQAAGLQLGVSESPAAALAALIGDRKLLLVVDSCEHVIDGAAEVLEAVLDTTPAARVLATSRERIGVAGEHVHVLGPLAFAEPEAPAITLLRQRAAAAGFELTSDHLGTVMAICEQLDGLPLAIELAAANLAQLRPDELLSRLDARFDVLEIAARGRRGKRHASLRQVLAASWDLLSPEEQALMSRLAVFPSSFNADDVDQITGSPAAYRTLRRLIDRSLVASSGSDVAPLRLLESVKRFAVDTWSTDADHRARHLDWAVAEMMEHPLEQRLVSMEQAGRWKHRAADLMAAERTAIQAGRVEVAAELLASGGYHARLSGGPAAVDLLAKIDELRSIGGLSEQAHAQLHLAEAFASLGAREMTRLASAADAAVRMSQHAGPAEVEVMALIVSSWRRGARDPAEGLRLLDEAVDAGLSHGFDRLTDAARSNRCTFLCLLDRNDEAVALARDVLARAPRFDYAAAHATSMLMTALLLDDPDEADALRHQQADRAGATGLPGSWRNAMDRALVAASLHDSATALELLDDARVRARLTGSETGLPDLLLVPAVLAHRQGDTDRCAALLDAIASDDRPTFGFPQLIVYRRLRAAIPAASMRGPERAAGAALDDALGWMADLAGRP
jgi:predicted ATPase